MTGFQGIGRSWTRSAIQVSGLLRHNRPRCTTSKRFRTPTVRAGLDERAIVGEDFGARDPTEGEIQSNFSEKVLYNWDTAHIIRGPKGMEKFVGLQAKRCVPCEGKDITAMDESEAIKLRNQVPGWRLDKDAVGALSLRQDWKVRNFKAGLELFKRIGEVAEAEGHHPDLHLQGYNQVYAVMSTHSVGGLTENDFIMAAKINQLEISDLQPKQKPRFWA